MLVYFAAAHCKDTNNMEQHFSVIPRKTLHRLLIFFLPFTLKWTALLKYTQLRMYFFHYAISCGKMERQ